MSDFSKIVKCLIFYFDVKCLILDILVLFVIFTILVIFLSFLVIFGYFLLILDELGRGTKANFQRFQLVSQFGTILGDLAYMRPWTASMPLIKASRRGKIAVLWPETPQNCYKNDRKSFFEVVNGDGRSNSKPDFSRFWSF